ncbi:MAG TPA: lipopolysaccharide heptosyltransferase II [Candidatus Acidoferrum sp.]|nr:lipopolysaccharide heptosyltransferase II [Candidatus Acidoferrum sp.]
MSATQNVLIRATNWVGDAIMAIPALRAVRTRFPQAHMAILARPYVADIYRDQHIADELIAYDAKGIHAGFSGRERLASELRARKFDTALLLQNAFDAAWLAWRAKIPRRIGYARDGRSLLLTDAIPVPRPGELPSHEKFYYLELLRRAGWLAETRDDKFIQLVVPPPQRAAAERKLKEAGARENVLRIAVGAGASYGSAKCWPPDRFAAALNHLQIHIDADVILVGTPAESAVADAIAAHLLKPPINFTGQTAIAELPALLSRCQAFLGNDSGAMHVAAAVGLPVVAVFGPTDPLGTAPVTPRVTIVQEKPYCSPCFLRRCPTDHRCMTALQPAAVEAAIRHWIADAGAAAPSGDPQFIEVPRG